MWHNYASKDGKMETPQPEMNLLADSLMYIPVNSTSAGTIKIVSGDLIIFQPWGIYTGGTEVKEGSKI